MTETFDHPMVRQYWSRARRVSDRDACADRDLLRDAAGRMPGPNANTHPHPGCGSFGANVNSGTVDPSNGLRWDLSLAL